MKPISIREHKGKFFSVLYTTPLSQVAVMTIAPKSDSGPEEVHDGDQIVYIIEGQALVEVDGKKSAMTAGEIVTIPSGSQHHIYNNGEKELFFLTAYTPPQY